MESRSAFVYLLRCADGSLYCGWTFDVEARLEVHQSGKGARYTRSRLPVELAAVIETAGEIEARREEVRVKGLSRGEKLELVDREAPGGPNRPSGSPARPTCRGNPQ